MSIDKQFEKRGIELTESNALPLGQRTQKNVKRVIAAVRAAEAEFNDELRDANERCRRAQEEVIRLTQRAHSLEEAVRRHRIAEQLGEIESLTTTDRQRLLESSEDPVAAPAV